MVKHIIMLALCFMVYIIINIDTVTAPPSGREIAARRMKFIWLIECYEIMFGRGLINIQPNLIRPGLNTFQEALEKFYTEYEISFVNEPDVGIIPTITNEMFNSESAYKPNREAFQSYFDQMNPITPDKIRELNGSPLQIQRSESPYTFNPSTNETPVHFCLRYSSHI